jgi:hypothetical protein
MSPSKISQIHNPDCLDAIYDELWHCTIDPTDKAEKLQSTNKKGGHQAKFPVPSCSSKGVRCRRLGVKDKEATRPRHSRSASSITVQVKCCRPPGVFIFLPMRPPLPVFLRTVKSKVASSQIPLRQSDSSSKVPLPRLHKLKYLTAVMNSKNQNTSRSQRYQEQSSLPTCLSVVTGYNRGSQTNSSRSKPTPKKRTSGSKSKTTSQQVINNNNTLPQDSRDSASKYNSANDYPTCNNNQDYNLPTSQTSCYNANGTYQDYNSMNYSNDILAGAESIGVDVPPHIQEALFNVHGKSWPNFDNFNGASVVSGSTCVELQEIENENRPVSWSIGSGDALESNPGGYFYGIGAQFEQ